MDNLYLELFGYLGTALVLISMMMTSVVKLRIFNLAGSVISMIYALCTGTWPVVLLNFGLAAIQVGQLLRLHRTKVFFTQVEAGAEDKLLLHFLESCREDIDTYFPGYQYLPGENKQVRMVYDGMETVGVLVGTAEGKTFRAELDYVTRKYRDCSIAAFLLACLKDAGYEAVEEPKVSQAHDQYLTKMGFSEDAGTFRKPL